MRMEDRICSKQHAIATTNRLLQHNSFGNKHLQAILKYTVSGYSFRMYGILRRKQVTKSTWCVSEFLEQICKINGRGCRLGNGRDSSSGGVLFESTPGCLHPEQGLSFQTNSRIWLRFGDSRFPSKSYPFIVHSSRLIQSRYWRSRKSDNMKKTENSKTCHYRKKDLHIVNPR
jgi:hypothetical protein